MTIHIIDNYVAYLLFYDYISILLLLIAYCFLGGLEVRIWFHFFICFNFVSLSQNSLSLLNTAGIYQLHIFSGTCTLDSSMPTSLSPGLCTPVTVFPEILLCPESYFFLFLSLFPFLVNHDLLWLPEKGCMVLRP